VFYFLVSDQLDVHVVQTFTFSLGMMPEQPQAQHLSMVTVCCLSHNMLFPPQFRTLQGWFHYVFANSETDGEIMPQSHFRNKN
jgi:hypothetical protein